MVAGLKLVVVPLGAPATERLIELLNPPPIVVVIVDVPWVPWRMLKDVGEAERTKYGELVVTVRVTTVVCWVPPPLPVMVMG